MSVQEWVTVGSLGVAALAVIVSGLTAYLSYRERVAPLRVALYERQAKLLEATITRMGGFALYLNSMAVELEEEKPDGDLLRSLTEAMQTTKEEFVLTLYMPQDLLALLHDVIAVHKAAIGSISEWISTGVKPSGLEDLQDKYNVKVTKFAEEARTVIGTGKLDEKTRKLLRGG